MLSNNCDECPRQSWYSLKALANTTLSPVTNNITSVESRNNEHSKRNDSEMGASTMYIARFLLTVGRVG